MHAKLLVGSACQAATAASALVSQLAEKLGVTADGGAPQRQASPHTLARPDLYFLWPGRLVIVIEFDENNHTDRTTKSEMQHLQVIKDWASNQHGISCLKVVRVNDSNYGRAIITCQCN